MKLDLGLGASGVFAVSAVAVLGFVAYKIVTSWAPDAGKAIKDAADAVNPLNHDNVIAGGVNKVLGGGDPNWTLGGAIYDATHADPMAAPLPDLLRVEEPDGHGVSYDAMGNITGAW